MNFSSREIFELERFHQTKYRKFLTYISRYPVINISNFFKRLIKLGQLDQSSNCSCQTVAKMMMDALERRGITRVFFSKTRLQRTIHLQFREKESEESESASKEETRRARACTWQGATRFDKRAPEYHQFERDTRDKTGTEERGVCVRAAWAKNLPLKSTPAAIRRPRDDNGRRVEKCP